MQMKTRIRTLRRARKWSQTELAEKAGLRQATVSKAETAPDECEASTLEALAIALEVPLSDLFTPVPGEASVSDMVKVFEALPPDLRQDVLRHAQALEAMRGPKRP